MRLFCFLIYTSFCFAQNTYDGVVYDEENKPIAGVVITAYNKNTPTETETIAVANNIGLFQLKLEDNKTYIIETRHLSYADTSIIFNTVANKKIKILLYPAKNTLDEILIKHEKPKVTIKRDTISYDILKYIDINDRKLKDLVEKLPGITLLEDGTIYFKGEKIAKLLVENQDFFGGGVKLGLDNIPADAIEKFEIISNYSKSSLLQKNRRSQQQVINLVLKKNRKSIVFGSLDGVSNFDEFYKLHGTFFQFLPKQQNNSIVDINNIAEQPLNDNETYSFANIDSELFVFPLESFGYNNDYRLYSEISNKLIVTNIKRIKEFSTWDFLGYYTKSKQKQNQHEFQENFNNNSFEDTDKSKSISSNSIFLRATNSYQTKNKERIFGSVINYNSQNEINQILSNSNLGLRNFDNNKIKKALTLGLILEEVKSLNNKSNLVYGFKLGFDYNDNQTLLQSNQQFLNDIIPWMNQNNYKIFNPSTKQTQSYETGIKFYNNFDSHNVFLASSKLIANLISSKNNQTQQLDDFSQNQLSNQFISNSSYNNFQLINTVGYRYNKNKWDLNFGVDINSFNLNYKRQNTNENITKTAFNPFLSILFTVNKKKQITFNYNKNIQLPLIYQIDNFIKVDNYTAIVIGNPQLDNTINQNLQINYSDFNIPKNYSLKTTQSLTIFDKAFTTEYEFNDINNISSYFIQNNNGLSFNSRNSFLYLFKYWELGLTVNYKLKKENILIPIIENTVNKSLSLSPRLRTQLKFLPNIAFNPILKFNEQRFSDVYRKFTSFGYQSKLDYNFSESLYAFVKYNYTSINKVKAFDRFDFEIRFTNKIKTFDVSIIGINATSSNFINEINQSLYFQTSTQTKILDKRLLLQLSYYF